jgi:HK97 family phage major capsid protein
MSWVEASTSKNVGYVKELAENSNKTDVTFIEKQRKLAKVATYMELSSELENWYEVLYDFCVSEGQRIILKDIDTKVWEGAGADGTKPDEIYGIKAAATSFSAVGEYDSPTIGDVIIDAIAQIKKAGFVANVAIVSYGTMAAIRGLKDKNGHYLYNEVNGMLGQVRVFESDALTNEEIVVADNFCAEVHMASLYELEFSRKASTDSWRVDFRRHAQVKVPTPKAKGIVYVADKAAAITAITK